MTKQGYFVMDSMERTLTYGVTVYQVWQTEAEEQKLQYETSSKAKANAVCEYLTLKAEQETQAKQLTMDRYMQGGIDLLTYIPRSIKIS